VQGFANYSSWGPQSHFIARTHFANEEKQYNREKFVDFLAETFPETITFV